MRTRPLAPRIPLLLAAALLTACGGGSGGGAIAPPPGTALLVGDFASHTFEGTTTSSLGAVHVSTWGTPQPDGLGGLTGTYTENRDGVIDGPWSYPLLTYDVRPDRTFELRDKFGELAGLGGVAPNGHLAAHADVRDDARPNLALWVRRGTGFTDADLAGRWCIALFGWASPDAFSIFATLDLDGAGGFTSYIDQNFGGTDDHYGSTGTYAVHSDGSVDMLVNLAGAGLSLTGQIAPDGNTLSVAGGPTGFLTFVGLGVKLGAGRSNATLAGEYFIVGVYESTGNFLSFTGSASLDGAGTLTFGTVTANNEGVISLDGGGSLGYAVMPDGGIVTGTGTGLGCVSAGGDVAMLGDAGLSLIGGPYLYVLVRK